MKIRMMFGVCLITIAVIQETVAGTITNASGFEIVSRLTGAASLNTTDDVGIGGTDLGHMVNHNGRIYFLFGDTFLDDHTQANGGRSSVMAWSTDSTPADGILFDDWLTNENPNWAEELFDSGIGNPITEIPTAAISIGNRIYSWYMSVTNWGAPGEWETDYSGLTYWSEGDDEFTVVNNFEFAGNGNFSMVAAAFRSPYEQTTDPHLYLWGTPPGRFGGVALARVHPDQITDRTAYEFFDGLTNSIPLWSSNVSNADIIVPAPAGEMSVMYNAAVGAWTLASQAYDRFEIRQAPNPWGPWSAPVVVATSEQAPGGMYAPYMNPLLVEENGETIYFTMSLWEPYDVYLAKVTLSIGPTVVANTIANWRFEEGTAGVEWSGDHDNHYLDSSGNGNHLSAKMNSQNPMSTSTLPFTSQGGTTNTLALDFSQGDEDHIGTWGVGDINDKMIDSYAFTNGFTIEATFKTENFDPWPAILSKVGDLNDNGVNGEPTLRMRVDSLNHTLECGFMDGATNWITIQSLEALHSNSWYSAAMTFDPATTNFSFYLKQEDGGDYVLQGSRTDVVDGTALGVETNFWKVGSSSWLGDPVEFFEGIIDEIKITDAALSTSEFINQDGFTVTFNIEQPQVAEVFFEDWDVPILLSASEYSSPAGYAFTGSVWQISTDDTFASYDWQGTTGGVETITVPASTLSGGNTYYARVQYLTDGGASAWSDAYQMDLSVIQAVAYWRFEELSDGERHDGDLDDFYQDESGNANYLSCWWVNARPTYSGDVPATLALAQTNNTAVDFYRFSDLVSVGTPDAPTDKMLNNYAFTNGWTVECSFRMRSLNESYWEEVLCKNGARKDVFPGLGGDMPPFTMKVAGDPNMVEYNKMFVEVIDDAGNEIMVWSSFAIELNEWYSYAATYNGDTLKLYVKTDGDDEYILQSSASVPAGISFAGWDTPWSVGRGFWDVFATGFIDGTVDEVRISDGALHPSKFIHQTDEFGAYDVKKPANINMVNFTGWNAPIRIAASEFDSPRGYSHAASQWQLSSDAGFASVAWDSGAIDGSNFVDIPADSLAPAAYYARVGYQANGTWAWSDAYPMDITTIAHWRFEEGPNGAAQASATDSSFYGNDLVQAGSGLQPTATNDVAFATVPQTWADNDLALSCLGGTRVMTSVGADLNTYAFTNGWTIECTFKFDAIWWQIILNKDGARNTPNGGSDWESPFWFKTRDDDKHLEVIYTRHETPTFDGFGLVDTLAPIEVGKWYSVAAVFDNETIKLYLKGENDSEYVLQRAYNENFESVLAYAADYAGEWAVGRGTGAGSPIDWFNGMVDEVKISNVPLQPGGFIADMGTGWDSDGDGMADSWEIFYFGSIAANPGDNPDGDDRDNLAEYRQGGDPTIADAGHASSTGTVALGGGTNAFEYVYPRRKYPYSGDIHRLETTDNLVYGTWANDGSVVISGVGPIDIEFDAVTNQIPMDTDEKFIKLIVE